MTTSINNSVNNSSAAAESNESKKGSRSSNPNNLNLILASEKQVKSGAIMWRVYRRAADGTESKPFYCANALKALRYAYVLKKKQGGFIPAAIYDKLKAAIEAMPEEERKQAAKKATTAQQAEPEPVQQAAPVEEAKPKPKKRNTKRTKKEAA
jgi:hypothetical protein